MKRSSGRVFGARPVPLAIPAVVPAASPLAMSPRRTDSPPSSELSVESVSSTTSDDTVGSAALSCPICNETMVTLLQLNRHLDDVHSQEDRVDQEQIKSWFRKRVEKARQLQTVSAVFNTGLSKLDLFDSDGSGTVTPNGEPSARGHKSTLSDSHATVNPHYTDDSITKSHWQSPTGRDHCSDPVCLKPLNPRNGSVNCRQCGKLFCSEHTMYEMKLSRQAKHDPRYGSWHRVCETCYKSREGYEDVQGTVVDITDTLVALRQKHIDDRELEVNKLEKRLTRLIMAISELDTDPGPLNYLAVGKRRAIEHSITVWQNDKTISECPICQYKFSYTLRKHHCRVCGRVVCADLGRDCSRDVQIAVLSNKLDGGSGDLPRLADVSVRICRDCRDTVFAKKNFGTDLSAPKSQLLKLYDSLTRIRHLIETMLMPDFQQMLLTLNDPDKPPPHDVLTEAGRIRKKLLESFSQLDSVARKILTCEISNGTEKRLQQLIYQVAAQFLQENMLPLKALPKILKHNKGAKSQLAESSEPPSVPALSDSEIQANREQLIVMEEQKFLLANMIADAKSHRRFDEVVPLEQSVNELQAEITKIQGLLGEFSIT